MSTHPITCPVSAIERRPRREREHAARPAADPNTINYYLCTRCEKLIWAYGIPTECWQCINGAVRAWGLGPIQGQVSGS